MIYCITVGGALAYDGTLNLTLTGGYFPQVGNEFALFTLAAAAILLLSACRRRKA